MDAFEERGEPEYMSLPQDVHDTDLAYHKRCPLAYLVKHVPEYEKILELYYHCKLCSEPQAYLEQQAFLTHIEECHSEHFVSRAQKTKTPQEKNKQVMVHENISNNAAGNSPANVKNERMEEDKLEDPPFEEGTGYSEIHIKVERRPSIEQPTQHESEQTEDIEDANNAHADTPVKSERSHYQDTGNTATDTPIQESIPTETDRDDVSVNDQAGTVYVENSPNPSKQNEAPKKRKSRNIIDIVRERMLKQKQEKQSLVAEVSVKKADGGEEHFVIDDMELKFEGKSQAGNQGRDIVLRDKDLEAIAEYESGADSSQNTGRSSQDTTLSQDSEAELNALYYEDQLEQEDHRSRCEVCASAYTPKHHPSCKRPHTSEKPSCSAYVCVKEKSEPVYPCPFCQRFFLNKHDVPIHVLEHQEEMEGKMVCSICDKEFNQIQRLVMHMSQCDVGLTATCEICHKEFQSRKGMLKHMENIHLNANSHACDVCGKTFNVKGNLVTHMRIHTGEKPYKCDKCDMRFRSKPNLLRHEMKHTGIKPYSCQRCDRTFPDKTTLTRHMITHSVEREMKRKKCRHCGKILKSERLLIKHIQAEHSDVEPHCGYPCDQCNKIFRDKHNMEAHKMIHTGERPFSCPNCGKTFRKNADLTIHFRIHTGHKPFKCELCPAAFTTNSNLNKHRMSHTGERPHQCKTCGRCFIDKSHLNRHHLTHTGEKPHPCLVCERSFATKTQMQQHMLIHTGEKPFICGACGKAFRQKAKAQRHRCLWKVINKPGLQNYQYVEGETEGEQMVVQTENIAGQVAVRVLEPGAGQGNEQVAYQLVEEGADVGDQQIAYQIIETTTADGGTTEQIVRMVQPGHQTAVIGGEGGDAEQIAYQIVDESGQAVSDEHITMRVLNQVTGGAGGDAQVVSAVEGGEQVAFQVIDGEAIQYQEQVLQQA